MQEQEREGAQGHGVDVLAWLFQRRSTEWYIFSIEPPKKNGQSQSLYWKQEIDGKVKVNDSSKGELEESMARLGLRAQVFGHRLLHYRGCVERKSILAEHFRGSLGTKFLPGIWAALGKTGGEQSTSWTRGPMLRGLWSGCSVRTHLTTQLSPGMKTQRFTRRNGWWWKWNRDTHIRVISSFSPASHFPNNYSEA